MNEIFTLKSTHDIISKWPQYKKPLGFKLVRLGFDLFFFKLICIFLQIDIDFKHLYPKAESLHVNFQNFCSKIDYVFEDRIKDPSSKVLFQTMSKMESLSESRLYLISCRYIIYFKIVLSQYFNHFRWSLRWHISTSSQYFGSINKSL